jgi:hypothetical protein
MRRFLYVLLILLLPLRGWTGDAMAMQMAMPGQHAPAAGVAQHADAHAPSAHAHSQPVAKLAAADCAEHVGQSDDGDAPDASHCEACAMCQTCHTVAVLLPLDLLAASPPGPVSPAATPPVYASADRALLLKPPIY